MLLMVVTLEVSKLSGWLNADAHCRESKGGQDTLRGEGAGQQTGATASRPACTAEARLGYRTGVERTRNICVMVVTLEVAHVGDGRDVPVGDGAVRRFGGSRVCVEILDRRHQGGLGRESRAGPRTPARAIASGGEGRGARPRATDEQLVGVGQGVGGLPIFERGVYSAGRGVGSARGRRRATAVQAACRADCSLERVDCSLGVGHG
eukprot:scaffold34462_cov56-Phaeocystis_antarctica.AAC.9